MNNYSVVITSPERIGQQRIMRKHEFDVVALTSCDAAINAVRSLGPQGNFTLTVKATGARP